MVKFLLVFFGGGIGSMLRYGVQVLFNRHNLSGGMPWSTLTVNLLGSLVIGLIVGLATRHQASEETRLLLVTGLCGGFTTFSTLSHDSVQLLRNGMTLQFALYVAATLVLGILLCYLGLLSQK